VPSWRTEPSRTKASWLCFRQVHPDFPPLFHDAGEPIPSQESGRWHRQGEAYAQYLSLHPLGAWAECARYYSIRSAAFAREQQRNMWIVLAKETDVANLSTFDRYANCGLDPRVAVASHRESQALADDLRSAGFRGVLSPSAALPDVVNLTIFGQRYEKVLATDLRAWKNPDPQSWLPCSLVSERGPVPSALTTETVFLKQKHEGYRRWLSENGKPQPGDPP
jgi:hypothetical protein